MADLVFWILECFPGFGFEFLDAFHSGQFLGYGAAEFFDGLEVLLRKLG